MSIEVTHEVSLELPKLSEMLDGVIQKRFEEALMLALANIDDPNREAKKARNVTIKLVLMPDEERRTVRIEAGVETKFPAEAAVSKTAFIGNHKGQYVISEHGDPRQLPIDGGHQN